MKKLFNLCIVSIMLILFSSCEDVIQVKLDKGNPAVTVDAFVNNLRNNQKIRLTYTDDYFSSKKNSPIVGASVVIKDLTNGQIFNFTDYSNGDYIYPITITDTIGRVNHTYQLTVTYNGTTFTANSKMNRTASVDSIDAEYIDESGLSSKKGYDCKFLGFDLPGDTIDYYWIKSFKNGVFFNDGNAINLAINGAYGAEADGFPFIPPIAYITPGGDLFQKFDVCRVEIHSIDLQTSNLLYQVQGQVTNSGLFATTPENIKTNLSSSSEKTKVVGWFCMSAVGFKEKIVQ